MCVHVFMYMHTLHMSRSDSVALHILGSQPDVKEGDSSILPEGHDETGMHF